MAILRKLPAAVAVAALTVTLYGCGGSSRIDDLDEAFDGTATAEAITDLRNSQAAAITATAVAAKKQEEAETARDNATTGQLEAERLQKVAETAQGNAETDRNTAMTARTNAEAAKTEAERLKGIAETKQGEAEEAVRLANEAKALVDEALAVVEKERDELQALDDEEAADKASAKANAIRMALLDNVLGPENDDDERLPADIVEWNPSAVTTGLRVISHTATSGGMLTTGVSGYSLKNELDDPHDGWRGGLHTSDKEELVVFTDIEDATATPIDDLYDRTVDQTGYTVVPMAVPDRTFILWADVAIKSDINIELMDTAEDVYTFTGTVRGLEGTFRCEGSMCLSDAGEPTGTEGWLFRPGGNGMIDVVDSAYLNMGWWLNEPESGSYQFDAYAEAVGVGHGARDNTAPATGALLTGSATYMGAAAGKYVLAGTEYYEGGPFTATASLTANFDADSTPDSQLENPDAGNDALGIILSGTISDFMTADGMKDGWMVTLKFDGQTDNDPDEVDMTADDLNMVTGVGATTSWTRGNNLLTGSGSWSATFHGSEEDTTHPLAVVGTFDAAIADGEVGQIVGAFGANKVVTE